MKVNYYIKSNGVLRRKENTLYFIRKGDDGNLVKVPIPVERVFSIFAYGRVTLSSGCIHFLAENDIPVHFFNKFGYKVGTFLPRQKKVSGRMLVAQVSHHIDKTRRLELARKFVEGSIDNILVNMQYYSRSNDAVVPMKEEVLRHREATANVKNIDELMGCEGNARKAYYRMFDLIVPEPFRMVTRTTRPPKNMMNALISFGNSLVYSTVLSEIYRTHLDPTVSFLHELYDRRFSLSLDIAEIFKPLLSDRVVLHLVMKGEIKENDFDSDFNGVLMNDSGRTKFLKHFEEKLVTTIKHRNLGRSVSYRGLVRLECYKLMKHLLGLEEYRPFVIWW